MPTGLRKIAEIPAELMKNREGQGPVNIEQIQCAINQQQQPAARVGAVPVLPEEIIDDEEGGADKKKGAGAKCGPGGVPGRDARLTCLREIFVRSVGKPRGKPMSSAGRSAC